MEVWAILDWPMALGILLALAFNVRRAGIDILTAANIMLALWFFANWFTFLNVGPEGKTLVNGMVWAIVDPLLALIFAATGYRLIE